MTRPETQLVSEAAANDLRRFRAQESLTHFARDAFAALRPDETLVWNWHLDAICEHLEACAAGQIKRLVINVPPGMMKSMLTSVIWPAWLWLRRPGLAIASYSYKQALSVRDAGFMRDLIRTRWFQERWGHVFQLKDDQNTKTRYENTRNGMRFTGSVGGGTGERLDVSIIDDMHERGDMYRPDTLETAVHWYDVVIPKCAKDPLTFLQLAIGQRVHQRDGYQHLLDLGFDHLCIPMHARLGRWRATSLGWTDPRAVEEELLFPERFPEAVVEENARALGPLGVAAIDEQDPRRPEGDLFKADDFRYYRVDGDVAEIELPDGTTKLYDLRSLPTIQASDTASEKSANADWTVTVTAKLTPELYALIVDVTRVRIEAASTFEHLDQQRNRWGVPRATSGIEYANSGIAAIQVARRMGRPFVLLKPKGAKGYRAQVAATMYQQGMVWHPAGRPSWLALFEGELIDFPTGVHDDQVDAMGHLGFMIQKFGRQLLHGREPDSTRVWADFPGAKEAAERAAEDRRLRQNVGRGDATPDGTAHDADDAPPEQTILEYLGF